MNLHLIDYVFWFASPALQLAVLVMMFRRGLHRDYPYFFNYTILQVVSVVVLAIIRPISYTVYYYVYYGILGLSLLISFAVLYEIFKDAFRPYERLRDLGVILFRWSALVVALVAVMWAINAAYKPNNGPISDAIQLATRGVRLMQCGLVFFVLLFSEYLGIGRRSLLFGISLGFGFFAAVDMLVLTGASHHGVMRQSTLSTINSAAYLMAVLIWFGYALAAAPSVSKAEAENALLPRVWDSGLEEAREPAIEESLLVTMEQTVEQLLYGTKEVRVNPS